MNDAFLASDSTDEQNKRLIWINPVFRQLIARLTWVIFFRIDAVIDDPNLFWVHVEEPQHVATGFFGHGDHRIGHFSSGFLQPTRTVVPVPQLFPLPWAQRLQ